jgi:hypothetical protein
LYLVLKVTQLELETRVNGEREAAARKIVQKDDEFEREKERVLREFELERQERDNAINALKAKAKQQEGGAGGGAKRVGSRSSVRERRLRQSESSKQTGGLGSQNRRSRPSSRERQSVGARAGSGEELKIEVLRRGRRKELQDGVTGYLQDYAQEAIVRTLSPLGNRNQSVFKVSPRLSPRGAALAGRLCPKWALRVDLGIYEEFRKVSNYQNYNELHSVFYEILLKFL